jgi:iron complex outermembrane receptor protein
MVGVSSLLIAAGARAAEPVEIGDLPASAKTIKEWVAQIEAATVQVTAVKLERTETGLDIRPLA